MLSLLAGVAPGVVIGLFYGALYTRFGVPSFVITLAGLSGFRGLQLLVLGKEGSLNLPFDSALVGFATRSFLSPALAYGLVAAVVAVYVADPAARQRRPRRGRVVGGTELDDRDQGRRARRRTAHPVIA